MAAPNATSANGDLGPSACQNPATVVPKRTLEEDEPIEYATEYAIEYASFPRAKENKLRTVLAAPAAAYGG
jgi:hypothetical protein